MKIKRDGHNVFPEFNRYAKIIKAATGFKSVLIYDFDTVKQAKAKSKSLRSWKYKIITRARDDKGRFTKGFVLICCR